MKFFQLVQTFYRTMGIYPSSSPQCQRDRPTFNFQNLFFLLSLTLMFISSTGYILLEATSIIEISQTFYVSVSEFACLIQFAITFWKITQMAVLIDTIDEFFEKRSRNDSFLANKYNEINTKIELLSKWMHRFVVYVVIPAAVLPAAIATGINVYVYDLGDESYLLPNPTIYPFDWRTPFGYSCSILFTYAAAFATNYTLLPLLSFSIGALFLIFSVIGEITANIRVLNELCTKSKRKHLKKKNKLLRNVVQDFTNAKHLIDLFIDIIGFSITLLFLWTFASVCCGLLTLEFGFSDEHLNNIELIRIVFLMLASFVVIGIACEFSARLTNQFETICDALLQCNWYLYPIKLQKMLIMVIVNVQQPVQVAGFGNTKCSRDSFKQTIQASFSYFMTFRSLG